MPMDAMLGVSGLEDAGVVLKCFFAHKKSLLQRQKDGIFGFPVLEVQKM